MKIKTFDTSSIKPITIKHSVDDKLVFKSFDENYNFGLQLKSYNFLETLRDRKTNYDTSYYLTDFYELSSVLELDTPNTFTHNSKFTTYVKINDNYLKYVDLDSALSFDSNFSTLDDDYFFTFNLSTNRFLYITKEINDRTYYGYIAENSIRLSPTVPTLSSHLFDYIVNADKLQLFFYRYEDVFIVDDAGDFIEDDAGNLLVTRKNNQQAYFINNEFVLTAASANPTNSTFDIVRNTLTNTRGPLNNSFSYYLSSFNKDGVYLDSTTLPSISNNYFIACPNYSFDRGTETLSGNILALQNQVTLEGYPVPSNHFNSQPEYLNREYYKIFSGNIQEEGYDKVYLSYNIGTKELHFPSSKLTYFTTPSSISPYTKLNINDSKIDYIGAQAGNNPLISDKVFKRREDFKNNNFSDDINATYLCSWLSGGESGEKLWVDRYYNTDSINFSDALSGTAFYNTVTAAGAETTNTFDISSRLTFEPNNDYAYYHIGELDYYSHIISLSGFDISTGLEILDGNGVATSFNTSKEDVEIICDGNTFGRFTTNHTGDLSMSFWLSSNDFSLPMGYQILGNFFEEGFSIFNTDYVTPNVYIPVGNKLLLMNTDLDVYDEIEITEGTTPVSIKGIMRRDNFNDFYVLGENNVIYVYSASESLKTKVTNLSGQSNLVIDDMDINQNRLYLGFNPASATDYFYYDFSDNTTFLKGPLSAESNGNKNKIYVSRDNNSISFFDADSEIGTGNEIAIDSDQNTYKIKQRLPDSRPTPYNLIYKNRFIDNSTNTIVLTGGNVESVVTNIICDDEDKLITLYDNNRIAKLKTTRELESFKDLDFLESDSTKYIDVMLDFEGRQYVKYYIIVERLSDRTLIHKLDKDFELVKTKSLGSQLVNDLDLTKSITGFYSLKKFQASKNRFKVVLKTKPKFTNTGVFNKNTEIIDFDISTLNSGYHHFAINVSTKQGYMDLYINGYKYQRNTFAPGKYVLDNPLGSGIFIGTLSTPYNITLASKLQINGKYFLNDVGIRGFRMYDRPLDYYEIMSHLNYHKRDADVVWPYPLGQRAYIDTIDRVFKFNIPEKKTNTYDVEIQNMGIECDCLKTKLIEQIKKELPKVTPYYDNVNNVDILS